MEALSFVSNTYDITVFSWDLLVTLGNLVWFNRPVGKVTPSSHPGYGGYWPEYRPPKEGDSRCSCPALNAMANHGIMSRSGRYIGFTELSRYIQTTYNLSPSFSHMACLYAARLLNKSYSIDTFHLEEIDLQNGIEHDGSLTRLDTVLQPNQAVKHQAFINELCSFATGKDATGNSILRVGDLSRLLGKRRAEAKATNAQYSLRLIHRFFSSAAASTILTIFGGRVDDVRVIFSEERLPEGWESRSRKPFGLTMLTTSLIALPVAAFIREADWHTDAEQVDNTADIQQAA